MESIGLEVRKRVQLAPRIIMAGLVMTFTGAALAQSPSSQQPRRPPVLRSSGVYSNDQSQNPNQKQSAEVDEGSVVRVSTSLISVPAVVMDRNGRYIANLRKEDFKIYEDGVEQNLAYFASVEKPFTVALMLDVSGSTQFQLSQIRDAANTFVSRLRYNDRMMAVTFDGKINVLTEPTSVSDIRRRKLHIPAVTDGTVLYDAVDFVLKRMAGIPGRKAIVKAVSRLLRARLATLPNRTC